MKPSKPKIERPYKQRPVKYKKSKVGIYKKAYVKGQYDWFYDMRDDFGTRFRDTTE